MEGATTDPRSPNPAKHRRSRIDSFVHMKNNENKKKKILLKLGVLEQMSFQVPGPLQRDAEKKMFVGTYRRHQYRLSNILASDQKSV